MFHFKYFLYFFVNITRSCQSRIILLTVYTSNFFQAIFLHVVWVLFTAFGMCVSSSTGFLVMPIFTAFKTPHGCWDVVLESLKIIVDLNSLSTELIKYRDISVGQGSFVAFSYGDSFYNCNTLFSEGWSYILFCSQCKLPTPDNFLRSVEFLIRVGSAFRCMQVFIFNVLYMPLAVHLNMQVIIPCFLKFLE